MISYLYRNSPLRVVNIYEMPILWCYLLTLPENLLIVKFGVIPTLKIQRPTSNLTLLSLCSKQLFHHSKHPKMFRLKYPLYRQYPMTKPGNHLIPQVNILHYPINNEHRINLIVPVVYLYENNALNFMDGNTLTLV